MVLTSTGGDAIHLLFFTCVVYAFTFYGMMFLWRRRRGLSRQSLDSQPERGGAKRTIHPIGQRRWQRGWWKVVCCMSFEI